MRRTDFWLLAVSVAVFCLGAAWAQDEQRERPSPEAQGQQVPKADKQEMPKADKPSKVDKRDQDEAKPAHQEHGDMHPKNESEHGEHARPAGKSAHIPDEKFHAHFGHEHHFTVTRVVHETRIVPGRTNFLYGGYTFVFVDPWPAEWAFTDDCYVDYIDGEYFLVNVVHPGVRIALFVQG